MLHSTKVPLCNSFLEFLRRTKKVKIVRVLTGTEQQVDAYPRKKSWDVVDYWGSFTNTCSIVENMKACEG